VADALLIGLDRAVRDLREAVDRGIAQRRSTAGRA
jgi:hypothetical protein